MPDPRTRWLVVEAAFADARGVTLQPRIVVDEPIRGEFDVTLRSSDGRERVARASMRVSHVRGALAPFAMVCVHGVTLEDVPAGTEVWAARPLRYSGHR